MLYLLSFVFYAHSLTHVTSHKTAGLEFPENTLEGFQYSLTLPVQAIEVDIHFTKDNQMVLSHDPVFDYENCFRGDKNKRVIISQTNLDQILRLRCYNSKFKTFYKIPTLDEILQAYKVSGRTDIEVNLEIKVIDDLIRNAPRYNGLDKNILHISESLMVGLILKKLRELNFSQKILFTSFSRELLLLLKRQARADESFRYGLLFKGNYAPQRLGLLVRLMGLECYDSCWWPNWKETKKWLTQNQIDVFMPNFAQLTNFLFKRGFKKHFQRTKLDFEIYPWTLNSKEEWALFDEYDFDGLITDRPTTFFDKHR